MSRYIEFFGLERDPFLDTADPYFYCELGALRKAKERLDASVDASRGLTVVLGEPGTGKTSLSGALEQDLLADDRVVLGKILDPTFASDVEFLIAVGRVFGLALPPRSSAALKNALKNFFFETAILEKRKLVLTIDEAQNLSDENLEALRLLLNYHVPQRKLLNILLFGQRTATRIRARVTSPTAWTAGSGSSRSTTRWPRRCSISGSRAGLLPGQQLFTPDARALLIDAAAGLPRRLTMVAHVAMQEASDRASRWSTKTTCARRCSHAASPRAETTVVAYGGERGTPRIRSPQLGVLFSRLFARRSSP